MALLPRSDFLRSPGSPGGGGSDVAALVARAKGGDSEAVGRLAELYRKDVHGFCDQYAPEAAEDVTQNLFMNLSTRLRGYEESGQFRGWLRSVALHLCQTWVRSAVRQGLETLNSGMVAAPGTTSSFFTTKVDKLRELAGKLPPAERAAWGLYAEGYQPREIAVKLGITPVAAATRVSRAKDRLAEWVVAAYGPVEGRV